MKSEEIREAWEQTTEDIKKQTTESIIRAAESAAEIMGKFTSEEITAAIEAATADELENSTIAELLGRKREEEAGIIEIKQKLKGYRYNSKKPTPTGKALRILDFNRKGIKKGSLNESPKAEKREKFILKTNYEIENQLDRLTNKQLTKAVLTAVWELGNRTNYFTAAMVYQCIAGTKAKKESQIEPIRKALEEAENTKITLKPYKNHREKYPNLKAEYVGRLIHYDVVYTENESGEKETIYKLCAPPCLIEYLKDRGQLQYIDRTKLKTSRKHSLPQILLENMLLAEAEQARTQGVQKVTYERIYTEVGANTEKKKRGTRERTTKTLEEWRESGYITSWKNYNHGQKAQGIEIYI